MAFWNRKKQSENIPELKEYYANEKREKSGMAWLLAIGSLLVTIIVILAMFYGGRWLYRTLTDDDEVATTETTEVSQPESSNTSNTDSSSESQSSGQTGTSSTNNDETSSSGSNQQGSSTNQTPSDSTTGSTNNATNVPDTGPGDTLAIALVATIVGTGLYQIRLRRR